MYGFFYNNSKAEYNGDPQTVSAYSLLVNVLHNPKSAIAKSPLLFTKIFVGLRSLCIIYLDIYPC